MPAPRPADRWPKGTGNAASSALEHAGFHTLEDITRLTERELLAMHGVGPKAVGVLKAALAERGLALRDPGSKASSRRSGRTSRPDTLP